MDNDVFKGWVAINYLNDGETRCWDFEKAGSVPVCGEGMSISDITTWDENVKNRTEEVKKYLNEHKNIKRYVILDDCFGDNYESDPEIHKHLVFVDALKGLQEKDLKSACEIMNMQIK